MTLGRTAGFVSNLRWVANAKPDGLTGVASTARQDDLADVDTSDKAVGLAERTTHTGLKSIGTGTRQHLVDTDDVERVGADAEMETFLAGVLDEVLVGANTGGLEGLGTQLLILVGDEVDAEREIVDTGALAAEIEDADLRVRYTTVEAGLRVWLQSQRCQCVWFPYAIFAPSFSFAVSGRIS